MAGSSSTSVAQTRTDGETEYENLSKTQRLKAAIHYTTGRICRDLEQSSGLMFSKQVIATIAETAWRHSENLATDLEAFANHAKRSTATPDDVKMLVRKSPHLLDHLNDLQAQLEAGRDVTKRRGRKPKASTSKPQDTGTTDDNEET